MKKKQLYEGFADDFRAAKAFRNRSDIAEQRRQRKIGNFIERNSGEWFSFYDMLQEKSQWYTVFSDIMYAFNFVYTANRPFSTRIFVENCTNSDISQLKREIATFIKRKGYECNIYDVFMENANDNVAEIKSEMSGDDMPAIVLVDSINVTQDMVRTHQATEEEIGDAIDRITEEILPECGVLVYFERWPQREDEYDDEYDSDDESDEPTYPEGYGTMEIDFDNVNESVSSWLEQNNRDIAKAIDILSDIIMEDYIDLDCFRNATDLAECDYDDLQQADYLMDYYSDYYPSMIDDMVSEPYSIKEFITKKKVNIMYSQWERLTKEYWEEWLEDDHPELVEAVYDLRDISRITDKDLLGGGGFESMRDLEIGVAKAVAEKIKKAIL
jgi:hypothetical protein